MIIRPNLDTKLAMLIKVPELTIFVDKPLSIDFMIH